jgi:hypothetical protein
MSDLTVEELLDWFGVKGSMSSRAEPMLRALGVDPVDRVGSMNLQAADLLTSERRREIIDDRNLWIGG